MLGGDLAAPEFIAFWLKDGHVLAGMNANVWDQANDIVFFLLTVAFKFCYW